MSQINVSKRGLGVAAILAGIAVALVPGVGEADGLLEEIKKRGQFNVATEAAYPPFEMIEDGKITGYSKHILDGRGALEDKSKKKQGKLSPVKEKDSGKALENVAGKKPGNGSGPNSKELPNDKPNDKP